MTALEALREKKRSRTTLTDLESVVLDAHYTHDPNSEGAAEELEALMVIMARAAMYMDFPHDANKRMLKEAIVAYWKLQGAKR